MRVQVIFRKGDGARYLSHLDLMATLEYAVRRAGLPVELSEGFNPRPRLSVAAPLPLGFTGEREILELALRHPLPANEIKDRLQSAVPPGIAILEVTDVPPGVKAAASRLRAARYRVVLAEPPADLPERVQRLLSAAHLMVEEEREGGMRRRDLRPFLLSLRLESPDELSMQVQLDGEGTVRPEQLLRLLAIDPNGATIVRESIELR